MASCAENTLQVHQASRIAGGNSTGGNLIARLSKSYHMGIWLHGGQKFQC